MCMKYSINKIYVTELVSIVVARMQYKIVLPSGNSLALGSNITHVDLKLSQ